MRSDEVATSTSYVRVLNQTSIFHHVYDSRAMSVTKIVDATGLSKPTVRAAIADLEHTGLLAELGQRTGAAGRAPMIYGPHPSVGWVAVVDVGRVRINVAVADLTGEIKESRREVSTGAAPMLVTSIIVMLTEILAQHGRALSDLIVVVIGGPGVFDPAEEKVQLASNLEGWEGDAVRSTLQEHLGPEVQLIFENDVNLGALGEAATAPGRDAHSFVYLHVGTGVGTGIVIDGSLHRGAHSAAGEAAFITMPWPDQYPLPAAVRARGAFETLAAASALVEGAHAQGYTGESTAQAVVSAAGAGDAAARRAVVREVEMLAFGLASVVAIIDPELVILGGGVGRHLGDYLPDIDAALERLLPLPRPRILLSQLGDRAIILGGIDVAVAAGRAAMLAQVRLP